MEPRPTRLSARLRVRDRIRQGVSLRRPLPSDVAINEAQLAANLRVRRSEADHELEAAELEELHAAVPVLHQQWNLVDANFPKPARRGGRAFERALRIGRRLFRPVFNQQTEYNASNARAISALMNRSLRQEEILKTMVEEAFDAISVSLRRHTEALIEIDRSQSLIQRDLERVLPGEDEVDQLAFAQHFRGSEDEVKSRLKPYVSRLSSGDGDVVDLAAGRGELLELLAEAGTAGRGLETSVALVDHCRSKGLPVERRAPSSYLEDVPAGSLGGVAAVGLVGSVQPAELVRLTRLAWRSLTAGGVLLVDLAEAPRFGPTQSYSPELVRWLLSQEGFEDVEETGGAVSGRKV